MENAGGNGNRSGSKQSKARVPPERWGVKKRMGKLIAREVRAATSIAAQWMTRVIAGCCGTSAIAPEADSSKA